jgi:ParB-like chromosome segregation protein Spo0J
MSKQTAKKATGATAAAAASATTAGQVPHTPTAPKHGAVVKYEGFVFVHVGSNYYNVFKSGAPKACLASGVTLERAKEFADKENKGQADMQKIVNHVKDQVAGAKDGTPLPSKAEWDGLPSQEAQQRTAEAVGVVKRTNAFFVDPKAVARVKKNGKKWNNRFDMGDIEQLAKSLEANGMLNPIRVQRRVKPASLILDQESGVLFADEDTVGGPIVFNLVDGDRRLSAVEHLIKEGRYLKAFPSGIPAIIVDKAQDSMTSLVQMFEANSGKALLPLEEAAAYQRMRDGFPEEGIKGLTIHQICARVGRKQVHVVEMLNLLKADSELLEAVKSGEVGKTIAKRIATDAKGNKDLQKELTKDAKQVGKDSKKGQALKGKLHKARVTKAAAKGKTIKIRALSNDELNTLGAGLASKIADKMVAADLPIESDMRAWIKGNPDLALAASFGALEALKASAGVAGINLDF